MVLGPILVSFSLSKLGKATLKRTSANSDFLAAFDLAFSNLKADGFSTIRTQTTLDQMDSNLFLYIMSICT